MPDVEQEAALAVQRLGQRREEAGRQLHDPAAGPGRSGWGSLARVPDRVVAVLGRGVVPAETPILRADDLGALRGDGIFETMHVRAGRPWLADEHLTRMARSAARLELPLPALPALAELVDQALAAWDPAVEAALRLVCTRGPEGGGPVTAYATVAPVPETS